MAAEVWFLGATAVLAVIAISAAIVAVSAARRIAAVPPRDEPVAQPPAGPMTVIEPAAMVRPAELEPRIVEGTLIVPPTRQQVIRTALGRPGVRLSIVAHGVAHALRAQSRDRILAGMRREYRSRRRARLQAGRRAVRSAQPTPPSEKWLGS